MAVTTKNEKLSLMSYITPFQVPIPDSSDGIGQGDKQHLIWGYAGVLWTAIVITVKTFAFRTDIIKTSDHKTDVIKALNIRSDITKTKEFAGLIDG